MVLYIYMCIVIVVKLVSLHFLGVLELLEFLRARFVVAICSRLLVAEYLVDVIVDWYLIVTLHLVTTFGILSYHVIHIY